MRLVGLELKRCLGLGGATLLAILLAAMLFFRVQETHFSQLWILPGEDLFDEVAFGWFFGALGLGMLTFGFDAIAGDREFLIHRNLKSSELATARTVAGLAILLVVLFVGIFLHGLLGLYFDADADLFLPSFALQYLALCSMCLTGFAAGAFMVTLRGSQTARFNLALFAPAAVFICSLQLMRNAPDSWGRSSGVFLVVQLGWSALLLLPAHQNFLTGNDIERPLPARRALFQGLAGCALVGVIASSGVGGLQHVLQRKLVANYPRVVEITEGEVGLVHGQYDELVLMGADHHALVSEDTSSLEDPKTVWSPWSHWSDVFAPPWRILLSDRIHADEDYAFDRYWEWIGWGGPWTRCYLTRPEGQIHSVYLQDPAQSELRPVRRVFGRGEDGERFSERTELVGVGGPLGSHADSLWLGDPEDGSLWHYVFSDRTARPQRVELPGGDRYRGWTTAPDHEGGKGSLDGELEDVRLIGEQDGYIWNGSAWRAMDESELPLEQAEDYEVQVDVRGPLDYTITVHENGSSEPILIHRYAPKTFGERLRAGGIIALELMRPTLTVLPAYFSARGKAHHFELFRYGYQADPLVRAGKRTWIVVLHGLGAIVLCLLARRRLKALGAESWRQHFWSVMVLLGGAPLFMIHLSLEPETSYRRPQDPEPPAPLLIHSP